MKVILSTDNKPLSILIKAFTFSKWHHGGVILGDSVIEARAKEGVIETPLEEFKKRYPKHRIIEIPHQGDYQQRLHKQLGKSYDWGAIFKFVFRGDWSKTDKWFCFELIAHAAGTYNQKYLDRVTAVHLLMMTGDQE